MRRTLALAALTALSLSAHPAVGGTVGAEATWRFNESAGTTAFDSTNGYDGTLSNGVTRDFGIKGMGLRFDGVDDMVIVPHDPMLRTAGSMTIEAWVKPADELPPYSTRFSSIVLNGSGESDGWNYQLAMVGNGGDPAQYVVTFYVFVTAGAQNIYHVTGTIPIEAKHWTHLAATFDAAGPSLALFVNGSPDESLGIDTGIRYTGSTLTRPLTIGSAQTCTGTCSPSSPFGGWIDEVAYWDGIALAPDTILDHASDPTVRCNGLVATLAGTGGSDTLVGTGEDDVILGRGGHDDIDAGAGDDVVCAGVGDDTVGTGPGNDWAHGGGGAGDLIDYSDVPGPVEVNLRTGLVTTPFGYGNDSIGGFEHVVGTAFGDTLSGDSADNTLDGGPGDDTLRGMLGDDLLIGGAGDDLLRGRSGFDALSGGPGDDTLDGGLGDDGLSGGAGIDTVTYLPAPGPVTANLLTGSATGYGTDTISAVERLVGSRYEDALTGDDGPNVLTGLLGSDALWGNGGDDSLDGGPSQDTLWGGGGDDLLRGRKGNDELYGEGGTDEAHGGAGRRDLCVAETETGCERDPL